MNQPQMRTWRVVVHSVGDIGCVTESSEDNARCAALSKYGVPGQRDDETGLVDHEDQSWIYENDDFDVRPA